MRRFLQRVTPGRREWQTVLVASLMALLVVATSFLYQVPNALAADNTLIDITMKDTNGNGQVDRLVVQVDNDSLNGAKIHDNTGWSVTDDSSAVTVSSVTFSGGSSVASTDPLVIHVDLDENDSDLTVDTDNDNLELAYAQQGADAGTEYNDSANTQLVAITGDDGAAPRTEVDDADPILTSSTPSSGATDVSRTNDITLNFSEPMDTTDTEAATTLQEQDADTVSYTATWSNGDETLTIDPDTTLDPSNTHTLDISGAASASTEDSGDLTTNFTFTTKAAGGAAPVPPGYVDVTPVACTLTAPNGGETLTAGTTTDVTWTTQGVGITNVNISYSTDAGSTWTLVAAGVDDGNPYAWSIPGDLSGSVLLKIDCRDSGAAVLDSDESDSAFTVQAAAEEVVEEPTEELGLPTGVSATDLVKLPNDGDPSTHVDSAVYYVGLDGMRHPFPSNTIFFSWYEDFSDVKVISADAMADIPLGGSVLSRPGSYWVKIQSVPDTYYVEPGSYVLRHIEDEATAQRLGGNDWHGKIIDISVTLFNQFTVGETITYDSLDNDWPAGSLVKSSGSDTVWYTTETDRREVTDAGMDANRFQERFVEENDEPGWQALPIGEPIDGSEDGLSHEQMTP